MIKKKALVTGITGQDGSYLVELLLSKNYEVVGLKRRTSTNTECRIDHIDSSDFHIEEYEISDSGSVYSVVEKHMKFIIWRHNRMCKHHLINQTTLFKSIR